MLIHHPEMSAKRGRNSTNDNIIIKKVDEHFNVAMQKLKESIGYIQSYTNKVYLRLSEVFKRPDRSNADLLKRLALEDKTTDSEPLHNLSTTSSYFYGRTDELKKISKKLESDNHELDSDIITLFGIGGVGKSSLGERYAKQSLRAHKYDAVFWIRSETLAAIQDSFVEIARVLGFELAANVDLTMNKVKEWLSRTSEFASQDSVKHELIYVLSEEVLIDIRQLGRPWASRKTHATRTCKDNCNNKISMACSQTQRL